MMPRLLPLMNVTTFCTSGNRINSASAVIATIACDTFIFDPVQHAYTSLSSASRVSLRESAPAQPDRIESLEDDRCTAGKAVRRHVLGDPQPAADHGVAADACELMHGRHPADDDIVFHLRMARKHCRIGHDDVVSDDTVVRNVHVPHQEAALPDDGLPAFAGPPVERRILPDRCPLTRLHRWSARRHT